MGIMEDNLHGGYEDILTDYNNILDGGYDDFCYDGHDKIYNDHENGIDQDTPQEEMTTKERTIKLNPRTSHTYHEMLIGALGGKLFMPNPGLVTLGHQRNGTPSANTPHFKHGEAHVPPTIAATSPNDASTKGTSVIRPSAKQADKEVEQSIEEGGEGCEEEGYGESREEGDEEFEEG